MTSRIGSGQSGHELTKTLIRARSNNEASTLPLVGGVEPFKDWRHLALLGLAHQCRCEQLAPLYAASALPTSPPIGKQHHHGRRCWGVLLMYIVPLARECLSLPANETTQGPVKAEPTVREQLPSGARGYLPSER